LAQHALDVVESERLLQEASRSDACESERDIHFATPARQDQPYV
jgi:hypothetical protein